MQKKRLKKLGSCSAQVDLIKILLKYISGLPELKFPGMLEEIDIREKTAHPSYKDMEQLDFHILLTDNYYVNPNSIHICFPIKIKKKTSESLNVESDLIPVNNFLAH